ncbi:hypothetical protein THIOM_001528 [Candidatus Thiomargarita nelsonii]|uniref:Uncharacterized protein n=1 Tax=Candidatus Thiomargarita nelsonii TaxID=1003181 RepID=A0A176S3L4_9GAMM|nr:hypothetical protein THIOM_001528 [Candidatus Thiomargarita nelsonii]
MNKYPEDPSLLEVRKWKEQCRQEDSQLTQAEYLEKLQKIAQTVSAQYHLNLPQKRT